MFGQVNEKGKEFDGGFWRNQIPNIIWEYFTIDSYNSFKVTYDPEGCFIVHKKDGICLNCKIIRENGDVYMGKLDGGDANFGILTPADNQ